MYFVGGGGGNYGVGWSGSMVSGDGCGTGNGGRRSSQRPQPRPQPEQGWGLQIYPLSFFKLLTDILKRFNCFFFYLNQIGRIGCVVLLTSAAKHEYQAPREGTSTMTRCANKRRWTATAKGQRKWRQQDLENILDRLDTLSLTHTNSC